MLEKENVTVVSLSTPEATLASEAAVLSVARRVWSASLAITQGKWVQCNKQ
jgi:hypothetical protein